MVDLFDEVEEELRRDQIRALWRRHGWLILSLAVLIVAAVAGWRGWQYWTEQRAQEAGVRFAEALKLSAESKHSDAVEAFRGIAATAPGGYAVLSRLRAAAELGAAEKIDEAIAAYDEIASDGAVPEYLRDVARLRAGLLLVDSDRARAEERLRPLTEGSNPFRHLAREMIGLAAYKADDLKLAETWFLRVNADPETPRDIRARVEVLLTLIRAAGPTEPAAAEPKTGS